MQFQRLKPNDHLLFEQAYQLCAQNIDPAEQKSRRQFEQMFAASDYQFIATIDADQLIGVAILFLPPRDRFCLLEYLVVQPRRQSSGIGAALVQACIQSSDNLPILAEVDSDDPSARDIDARRRRIRFYRRMGFRRVANFSYILPLSTPGLPMDLSVLLPARADPLTKSALQHWLKTIYEKAYACSPADPRIAQMTEQLPDALHWD